MKKLKDIRPDECPEEFGDCEVLYENSWSDYEECGWIVIFKFFEEMFAWEYTYSVMAADNSVYFDPHKISLSEYSYLVHRWNALIEEIDKSMSGGY